MSEPTTDQWNDAFSLGSRDILFGQLTISQITHAVHQHAEMKLQEIRDAVMAQEEGRVDKFLELEARDLTDSTIRVGVRQMLKQGFDTIRDSILQQGIRLPANAKAYTRYEKQCAGRTLG